MTRSIKLVFEEPIDSVYLEEFSEVVEQVRPIFQKMMGDLPNPVAGSTEAYYTMPYSRNTLSSPLFFHCCCLAFIKQRGRQGDEPLKIEVESPALYKLIKEEVGELKSITTKLLRVPQKKTIRAWGIYVSRLYYIIRLKVYSYLSVSSREVKIPRDATLLDLGIIDEVDSSIDHAYPGLLENLSEDEKDRLFFLYHFPIEKMTLRKFQSMQAHRGKKMIKENYLKGVDYILAIKYTFNFKKYKVSRCEFMNMDISSLFNEELKSPLSWISATQSHLYSRFARRLRDCGVEIKTYINWYENQVAGRGLISGFRASYPNISIKGYLGFFPYPNYCCLYPVESELDCGVLPDQIYVVGPVLVDQIKLYCPSVKVLSAPAFRYSSIFNKKAFENTLGLKKICLALPHSNEASIYLLEIAFEVARKLNFKEDLLVKFHPAADRERIDINLSFNLPAHCVVENKSMDELLKEVSLFIGSSSGTCFQALAHSVPVIVIADENGLTLNPLSELFGRDLWTICYKKEQLLEAIEEFRERGLQMQPELNVMARKIREKYLTPVNPKSVRDFIFG